MDAEVQRVESQAQHHCTAEVTEGADGIHGGLASKEGGGEREDRDWNNDGPSYWIHAAGFRMISEGHRALTGLLCALCAWFPLGTSQHTLNSSNNSTSSEQHTPYTEFPYHPSPLLLLTAEWHLHTNPPTLQKRVREKFSSSSCWKMEGMRTPSFNSPPSICSRPCANPSAPFTCTPAEEDIGTAVTTPLNPFPSPSPSPLLIPSTWSSAQRCLTGGRTAWRCFLTGSVTAVGSEETSSEEMPGECGVSEERADVRAEGLSEGEVTGEEGGEREGLEKEVAAEEWSREGEEDPEEDQEEEEEEEEVEVSGASGM